MSLGNRALVVAIVLSLGLWGCAKGPANGSAAQQIKDLQSRIVKLEDDFRAVASARDQARAKLKEADDARGELLKQRDDLRAQIKLRTGERDAVNVQYEQFRKAIRDLVGQAETGSLSVPPQPITVTGAALPAGKS